MIIRPYLIEDILTIDTLINLDEIDHKVPDIISVDTCHASGIIKWSNDNLFVDLKIDAKLVLVSTRTLKPIEYNLSFPLNLIFGEHKESDFILTNEIDLSEIIYGHIILEKPLSLFIEGEEVYKEESDQINPFFSELKDMKF